jgi:tetratricopeptide (TPR) repeat protein
MYFYRQEDFQTAEPFLARAEKEIKDLLAVYPHSDVHSLYAEVLGLKMLIGGIGAIIANVFTLEHHLEEAQRLDEGNLKAKLIAHLKYVHGPPLLAQDLNRAEEVYGETLERIGEDRQLLFINYHTLGSIWANKGKMAQALEWYKKALELYPGNTYVQGKIYELGLDPVAMGYPVPAFLRQKHNP